MNIKKTIDDAINTIVQRIIERLEVSYDLPHTFATMQETELTPDERELLEKLGKDKDFETILDKMLFRSSSASLKASSHIETAEVRGFYNAFLLMKSYLHPVKKEAFNQVTGQPESK